MLLESPVAQFTVKDIGNKIIISGYNLSFSNSALAMLITAAIIILFYYIALKKPAIIPNKLQMLSEITYDFSLNLVQDNINSNKAKLFFPLIFSIFIFFVVGNMIGLLPMSFAFTSQLIITMCFAAFILILATVYGIYYHGLSFIRVLLPSGLPIYLAPMMVIIEFVSYFARGLSMGVRLFANIMAGHVILDIFASFVIALGIFGIIPLSFTVVLYAFEFAIGLLQAYIFAILSCIFIDQVINLH
ncbi:ATP synthase subunit a [Candidatus Hepatincola sp. Pdp]